MTNLRIPPRQDFDVSEQVYEWFRTLSTEIQSLKTGDAEEGIDLLLGFFSDIEKQITDLESVIEDRAVETHKISNLEKSINNLKSFIDTGELLSGRIDLLSRAINNIDIDGILVSLGLITKEKAVNIYGSMLISEQEKDITIPALNHENMVCDIFIEDPSGYNFKEYMGCGLASNTLVKVFKAESVGSVNFKIRIKER